MAGSGRGKRAALDMGYIPSEGRAKHDGSYRPNSSPGEAMRSQ